VRVLEFGLVISVTRARKVPNYTQSRHTRQGSKRPLTVNGRVVSEDHRAVKKQAGLSAQDVFTASMSSRTLECFPDRVI
jgi:hypothetical protein